MITSRFKILNLITSIVTYQNINHYSNLNQLVRNKNNIINNNTKNKYCYNNDMKFINGQEYNEKNKMYLHSKNKFKRN